MNTTRPQPALCDFKTAAFAQQNVRHRHAHVHQIHFGVAMRRIVVSEHRQIAHHLHALRIGGHQHHGLLLMTAVFRIGLAHDDEQFAARIVGAAGPPFAAIDHVLIAFTADAAFDVGGVRGSHRRFGH
jgi:hypothetical protein